MRLAPVPVFFRDEPERAIALAGESSRTTHGAATAVDACRYFAGLIVGALQGASKEQLLAARYHPGRGQWSPGELHPEIDEVASGSFLHREPPEIKGTGYVVRSLEAALWAFARGEDFRGGAHYGLSGIPHAWHTRLALRERVIALARGLLKRCPV